MAAKLFAIAIEEVIRYHEGLAHALAMTDKPDDAQRHNERAARLRAEADQLVWDRL